MDIDVLINNIFIDLARKGSLNNAFQDSEISLKDVAIEKKVIPAGKPSFPADIILYSRKYTYFLVIEVKNTASTSLNLSQADSYTKLLPASFTYVGINPSQIRHDVSYLASEQHHAFVSAEIAASSHTFPVMSIDLEAFKIGFKVPASLRVPKIARLFNNEVVLNISSLDEVPHSINFGVNSSLVTIARVAVTELIAQTQKRNSSVSIKDVTKGSFSNIAILWDRLDAAYKNNLYSRVATALRELINRGVTPLTNTGDQWLVDIFDTNQRVSSQKLTRLQGLIQQALAEMTAQPGLFE